MYVPASCLLLLLLALAAGEGSSGRSKADVQNQSNFKTNRLNTHMSLQIDIQDAEDGEIEVRISDKRNREVKLKDLGLREVKRKPKITSLTYENCGGSKDPASLVTLKLKHDRDGDLVITATGSTSLKLEPPIRVRLSS
uniref:(California timema) hypothetical protein n=1 Tax=Timema californicum TaxID=61474 RepID=A0A7R9JHV1_TIMCA|nr:unnamed protein product [Timema californicum]